MNKERSAAKIKMNSFDDLFQADEKAYRSDAVRMIKIEDLHEFKNHPFKVRSDKKMDELKKSIKEHGVLVPGIVRERSSGGYEIVSGHSRKAACEALGIKEMPMLIRDLNDDEAVIVMVDSNIQREDILPSEKARAYRMKYEAIRHQGKKGNSLDVLSTDLGENAKMIQRYIWLAELSDELITMVDEKILGLVQGVDLSFLKSEEMDWVASVLNKTKVRMSTRMSGEIKRMSKEGSLTEASVWEILVTTKKRPVKVILKGDILRNYFTDDFTKEDIEKVIISLLDEWKSDTYGLRGCSMTNIMDTGNKTVDALGQMNITGNITPMNWYKTILRENGKPYLLAICILSEICYWYRPKEVRDEQTGQVVQYKKRFKEDLLQKSYAQLSEQFGESKRTVKAAMDRLEEIGVIKRVWRNKTFSNGVSVTNILYIDLNEKILLELTYGKVTEDEEEFDEKMPETPENRHVTKFCTTILQKNVPGPTKLCNTILQENVPGDAKLCNTIPQNYVPGGTKDCNTNTEILSETYKENTSNPILSDNLKLDVMERMDLAETVIKKNTEYEWLKSEYPAQKKQLDGLIDIMVETVAFEEDVFVSGRRIPYQYVKSRFLKYDHMIMGYILDTLRQNTTEVHNVKNYLLATLLNAPLTMDSYYSLKVNHDMEDLTLAGEMSDEV